jgi:hypothetical protein
LVCLSVNRRYGGLDAQEAARGVPVTAIFFVAEQNDISLTDTKLVVDAMSNAKRTMVYVPQTKASGVGLLPMNLKSTVSPEQTVHGTIEEFLRRQSAAV